MNSRIILTVAAAGLVCAHALAAPPATPPAKPTAADPWAKVPALTTACYSSQDNWWERHQAAFDAIEQDHNRQNDINGEIQQQANEADPFAAAQRMQQAMMDDPQNAQKIMEQMMQQGQQAQAEAPVRQEKKERLEAESKAVMKQYQAALDKVYGPGIVRLNALHKRMGIPWNVTNVVDGGNYGYFDVPFWPRAESFAILKEWDKAYVAHCAHWWSATGPIHAYMKRYKDFLVLEHTPYLKKLDETKLEQYRAYNVPFERWRSTADYDAIEDYLKMVSTLFGERYTEPLCRQNYRCE